MPIYEYECMACGRHDEVFQKMSDKPLKKCSHCAGKLQKIMSQSSFHLKGSGWYVTDYANSAKPGTSTEKSEKKNETSKANVAKTAKAESSASE